MFNYPINLTPDNGILNVVRQLAINLLKKEPSKLSIKRKRFRAALSDQFRENVIFFKLIFICACPVPTRLYAKL